MARIRIPKCAQCAEEKATREIAEEKVGRVATELGYALAKVHALTKKNQGLEMRRQYWQGLALVEQNERIRLEAEIERLKNEEGSHA